MTKIQSLSLTPAGEDWDHCNTVVWTGDERHDPIWVCVLGARMPMKSVGFFSPTPLRHPLSVVEVTVEVHDLSRTLKKAGLSRRQLETSLPRGGVPVPIAFEADWPEQHYVRIEAQLLGFDQLEPGWRAHAIDPVARLNPRSSVISGIFVVQGLTILEESV